MQVVVLPLLLEGGGVDCYSFEIFLQRPPEGSKLS
jgi:hypothetical protein